MTADNDAATDTEIKDAKATSPAKEADAANGKVSDRKVSPSPRKAAVKETDSKKAKPKGSASSRSRSRSRSRLALSGGGVVAPGNYLFAKASPASMYSACSESKAF